MIEKVLHLQWVHRDDNETTVEEIESAFYDDAVEQDSVMQDTTEQMTLEFKAGDIIYALKPLSETSIFRSRVYGVVISADSILVRCNFDDGSEHFFNLDGTHASGNKRFRLYHYSEATN
jgi:hypothetical protein